MDNELQQPPGTTVESVSAAAPTITEDARDPSPTGEATTVPETQAEPAGATVLPKRQRRPSVRLGDIGEQSAATLSSDPNPRRQKHHHPPWRTYKDPSSSSKSVKARSITNLVNNGSEANQNDDVEVNNGLDFGFKKAAKAKRGTGKRVRTNWGSKHEGESREDGDEGFRDFGPEIDSPVHSVDLWNGQRRSNPGLESGSLRVRVSDNRENELDFNPPESDSRGANDGVMSWLIDLGLSRYAPVFEIHEVDDEVLPMLTLEDLKDMGITAVGSRRKLYSAIQKLRRGLS